MFSFRIEIGDLALAGTILLLGGSNIRPTCVGALINRIGFGGLLSRTIVYVTPKPYSSKAPYIIVSL